MKTAIQSFRLSGKIQNDGIRCQNTRNHLQNVQNKKQRYVANESYFG